MLSSNTGKTKQPQNWQQTSVKSECPEPYLHADLMNKVERSSHKNRPAGQSFNPNR